MHKQQLQPIPPPDESPSTPLASKKPSHGAPSPEPASIAQLRADLLRAQQERTDLSTRLANTTAELSQLQSKTTQDTKRISKLSAGVTQMSVRVRDRNDELKAKSKMLEEVQDQIVALNLELNMSEEKAKRLEDENRELVGRWMKRKGKEVEEMNERNERGA